MADNCYRLLLIQFLYLFIYASCVTGKICINKDCSEPISSSKVTKDFKTSDVHLLVGDEVDVISKSDDGSMSEFEIGDVRGVIPSAHLRDVTLFTEMENLIHIPDEEDADEDDNDNDNEDNPDGEIERNDENEPLDPEYAGAAEKKKNMKSEKKVFQKKQKAKQNVKQEPAKDVGDHQEVQSITEQTSSDEKKQEVGEVSNGEVNSDPASKLKEFFKSEEEAHLKTFDKKASFDGIIKPEENEKLQEIKTEEKVKSDKVSEKRIDDDNSNESKKDKSEKDEPEKDELKKDESEKDKPEKEEAKEAEPKKDESKEEETNKDKSEKDESEKDDPKKEESKEEEAKKEEAKKEEAKKDESKKEEAKKEESKEEEAKKEESKEEEAKKEESKKEKSKKEESKKEESKELVNHSQKNIDEIPQETIFTNDFHAHQSLSSVQLDLFRQEMQKLPNFKIIKNKYVKDYLFDNYPDKAVDDATMKNVEDFIVDDIMTQLREPGSSLMDMMTNYDPKDLPVGMDVESEEKKTSGDLPGGADVESKEKKATGALPGGADVESEEKKTSGDLPGGMDVDSQEKKTIGDLPRGADVESEEKKPRESIQLKQIKRVKHVDFLGHPNFIDMKKKHVEQYLKTHYDGEHVDAQVIRMVESFIADDLLIRLREPGSKLAEELLKEGGDGKTSGSASGEEDLKAEKNGVDTGIEDTEGRNTQLREGEDVREKEADIAKEKEGGSDVEKASSRDVQEINAKEQKAEEPERKSAAISDQRTGAEEHTEAKDDDSKNEEAAKEAKQSAGDLLKQVTKDTLREDVRGIKVISDSVSFGSGDEKVVEGSEDGSLGATVQGEGHTGSKDTTLGLDVSGTAASEQVLTSRPIPPAGGSATPSKAGNSDTLSDQTSSGEELSSTSSAQESVDTGSQVDSKKEAAEADSKKEVAEGDSEKEVTAGDSEKEVTEVASEKEVTEGDYEKEVAEGDSEKEATVSEKEVPEADTKTEETEASNDEIIPDDPSRGNEDATLTSSEILPDSSSQESVESGNQADTKKEVPESIFSIKKIKNAFKDRFNAFANKLSRKNEAQEKKETDNGVKNPESTADSKQEVQADSGNSMEGDSKKDENNPDHEKAKSEQEVKEVSNDAEEIDSNNLLEEHATRADLSDQEETDSSQQAVQQGSPVVDVDDVASRKSEEESSKNLEQEQDTKEEEEVQRDSDKNTEGRSSSSPEAINSLEPADEIPEEAREIHDTQSENVSEVIKETEVNTDFLDDVPSSVIASPTQTSRQLLQVDEDTHPEPDSSEHSDAERKEYENQDTDQARDSSKQQEQDAGVPQDDAPKEQQESSVSGDSNQSSEDSPAGSDGDSPVKPDNEEPKSESTSQQETPSDDSKKHSEGDVDQPKESSQNQEEEVTQEPEQDSENQEDVTRDDLLELCHNTPSLPACEQLRGTKVFRTKRKVPEDQPDIGRLNRAWRNLMKIMQRIKAMKLAVVRLFHGPLTVLGLDELSHWMQSLVEEASPEIVTITVCCGFLVLALFLKWLFAEKTVQIGVSMYDVQKMKQSQQRILQENSENLEKEIQELREKLTHKDRKVNSGDDAVKELETKLKSLRNQFENQEKTLSNIRKEVATGKKEQKKLHELIEEKEKEIHQADHVALRHQSEIERQTEITENLNSRLEKVVEELDLKDGFVLEIQEKIGALHVELENMEMERRQIENEKKAISNRCEELEETLKTKDEENAKLQDEIDEKDNEVEVLRECMAQINNGKLDGEALEDFETPEDDPDIKEQLKTERLKQILETTHSLADLRKNEKEKEFFQEGYLEELEKREKAEEKVEELQISVDKLSRDSQLYKTSSTEMQIKLDTLQHYFRQQETELHRKLSSEEQLRVEYQRKYEAVIGQSTTAVEESSNLRLQIDDLKNEVKEIERTSKEKESGTEKELHDIWIKYRQANRDAEEMKRERDIYRKRLLEAETTKKRTSPVPSGFERSRDSPGGSDEGRPTSPVSQLSGVSGVPNFAGPRPPFGMVPPPPSMFGPPGPMGLRRPMPMGPMPPRPGMFGPMPPRPPMMGGPQNPMAGPQNPMAGQNNPMSGLQGRMGGPNNPMAGPQNPMAGQNNPMPGQNNPMSGLQGRMAGPQNPMTGPQNPMTGPQNPMAGQNNPMPGQRNSISGPPNTLGGPPSSLGGSVGMSGPLNPPLSYAGSSSGQNAFSSSTQSGQFAPQSNFITSTQDQRPLLARNNSQQSFSSNSGTTDPSRGQPTTVQRGFGSTSSQVPFQSTPINSPQQQQQQQQQGLQQQPPIPNNGGPPVGLQNNQFRRQQPLQRRPTGSSDL